jgi:MFS family permease
MLLSGVTSGVSSDVSPGATSGVASGATSGAASGASSAVAPGASPAVTSAVTSAVSPGTTPGLALGAGPGADLDVARAWVRVGLLLFAVGWGANHFVPLLLVYRARLALDPAALSLVFGMYALGLVPGLLLAGPISDRVGRRAVVLPASCAALAASGVLGVGGGSFAGLLVGRLLYGLGAGGAMSAGTAWIVDLSASEPLGAGPRRATIALSAGFGLGPLVSGAIAQYAPAPTVLPYAVHVALLIAMLALAWRTGDAGDRAVGAAGAAGRPGRPGRLIRIDLDPAGWRGFRRGVAPMAPFVFGFPALVLAALPGMLGGMLGGAPVAYTGLLAVIMLGAGVLVQPVTRRLDPTLAARLGLVVGAGGTALGAAAVAAHAPALLLAVAPILGTAYGVCMTAGLQSVQRLARPDARGGITGLYLVLTYVGFAAPYLLALATRAVTPVAALLATAALALAAAASLRRPA